MTEWKECKLGDVAEVKYGKDHKTLQEGKIPCYGSGGLMRNVSDQLYDKESILIPRKGTLNNILYENNPFWTVDTMFWTKINSEKTFPKYLFYQLTLIDYSGLNVGSAVPSLTVPVIRAIDILLPPLPEQRAIANVLSSLDDKIDLLHRQNKTLEAMAETLFRQWFVEEADDTWEEVPLKKVVDISIGRTPPRKEFHWFSEIDTDIKWISIKDLGTSGVFVFTTAEYLTKEAVTTFNIPIIPINTVILSFKMTVGRVAITTEPMLSNEAIAHFCFTAETPFTKEYLYLFLKTFRYDSLGSTSSIVTAINSAMIKEMLIKIPDHKSMSKFRVITEELFNKVRSNQIQIRTLESLRDTLLPKLMFGEVRVDLTELKEDMK